MQRLDQFHRGTCTVASYHERSHVVELSLQTHGYVLNGDANLTHFVHSLFFVRSRRRHTRCGRDWSSDVCSSDLEGKDRRALEGVVALEGAELLARCRRERISMCGRAPAATVLAASVALGGGAGGDARAAVVHYSHSGMTTGDDDAVVGYGGVVIT